MTWKDDPETIWQDKDGNWLIVGRQLISVGGSEVPVALKPETLEDRIEAATRFLTAMGLVADNIRELSYPIGRGDRVESLLNSEGDRGEVLGGPWDDNGEAMVAVRWDDGTGIHIAALDELRYIATTDKSD